MCLIFLVFSFPFFLLPFSFAPSLPPSISPLSLFPSYLPSFLTALLRHNAHTTELTYLKCKIQWFLVYSQSCETIIEINFRKFSSTQKETPYLLSHSPIPLIFPAIGSYCSTFCIDKYSKHFMKIESYSMWLLCLASFIYVAQCFKVHLCCTDLCISTLLLLIAE